MDGTRVARNTEKVFVVLVTYNRKDLLLECLDGLLRQTRPIDGLVLIDNASTDGTADALYAQKFLPEVPPLNARSVWEFRRESHREGEMTFVYLRLPVNEGGSGGFHEGVKKALEFDCDWLWMMDDDVEPDEGCLQGQLAFSEISKCIHPRKYFQDGLAHEWEGYISAVTGRRVFQPDISFRKGFSFCTINTGCFEGMLIHRSVVEKIGLPDKRFFLGGDDSVYGFLAHYHTPVLYLRDPRINKKKIYQVENNPIGDRSIYYGMRNTFLMQRYLNEKMERYRLIRSFFILVRFVDYALNILQNRPEKFRGYRVLMRAFRDGLTGNFGKGL
ncbi:glycosyltransferase family 2 protein [Leptospirillum ferriphilum]|uniref:Family 2 glycosyl transferase n=1 Tax=Leptospirillum ferriphilum YSK TaxID=1441628 RepID=A0A059XNP1_9BACT|nr:glycosyltransferase family 2 protein [Leptospirillum ferriphilum]AIA30149.1 family 2 glycosyl transferase [Leptospirillum ferriphilum YSK]OOH83697.1 glycosyl transferase, family 2 [Leptospirillum ferriphilum]